MVEEFRNKFRTIKSISNEIAIVGLLKVFTTLFTHMIFKDFFRKDKMTILLPIVFIISATLVLGKEFTLLNKRNCDKLNSKIKKSFLDKFIYSLIYSLIFSLLLICLYTIPFGKPYNTIPLNIITTFCISLIQQYTGFDDFLCSRKNQKYGYHTLKAVSS